MAPQQWNTPFQVHKLCPGCLLLVQGAALQREYGQWHTRASSCSVVDHVLGRSTELLVALDDLQPSSLLSWQPSDQTGAASGTVAVITPGRMQQGLSEAMRRTFCTASRKSFSETVFLRARMANMPASVQTLRTSAPVALGHNLQPSCLGQPGSMGRWLAWRETGSNSTLTWTSTCHPKSKVHSRFKVPVVTVACAAVHADLLQSLTGCAPGQQFIADIPLAVHRAGVYLEDLCARLQVWQPKLHLGQQQLAQRSCHQMP